MSEISGRQGFARRRLRRVSAGIVLALGASLCDAATGYWADKSRIIAFAAIAMNRSMAAQYEAHARASNYWGDPERCGALYLDYLDRLESRLGLGELATLPAELAAAVQGLDAPQRIPEAKFLRSVDRACTKSGLKEYGSWCSDMLTAAGLSNKSKLELRVAGAKSFLAGPSAQPPGECARTAAEGAAWLQEKLERQN